MKKTNWKIFSLGVVSLFFGGQEAMAGCECNVTCTPPNEPHWHGTIPVGAADAAACQAHNNQIGTNCVFYNCQWSS